MPRDHRLSRTSAKALRTAAQITEDDVAHARETARRDCTTLIYRLLEAQLDTRERSGA